jgi:hypothetical protein
VNRKNIIIFTLVAILCAGVIVETELLFSEAENGFSDYIRVKEMTFEFENLPAKMMTSYFANMIRIINNESRFDFPQEFYGKS